MHCGSIKHMFILAMMVCAMFVYLSIIFNHALVCGAHKCTNKYDVQIGNICWKLVLLHKNLADKKIFGIFTSIIPHSEKYQILMELDYCCP